MIKTIIIKKVTIIIIIIMIMIINDDVNIKVIPMIRISIIVLNVLKCFTKHVRYTMPLYFQHMSEITWFTVLPTELVRTGASIICSKLLGTSATIGTRIICTRLFYWKWKTDIQKLLIFQAFVGMMYTSYSSVNCYGFITRQHVE